MKQLLLFLLFLLPYGTYANEKDTLIIKHPKSVTVISGDSILEVQVKGREGDDGFVFHDKIQIKDSHFYREHENNREHGNNIPKVACSSNLKATAHLGFGLTAPTGVSSGVKFSLFSSWEIFFTPFVFELYMSKNKTDLISLGIGFDWRNYRMTNDTRFRKGDDGKVMLDSYPEGASPDFSRIKVFSLNFPLLYQHQFNRDWGIGIGPVFNLNTYASVKTRYKKDGGKHEFVEKHIGQRKFTVDIMATLENPLVDLYVKYSPMEVLKDSEVKFRSLSFGFYF